MSEGLRSVRVQVLTNSYEAPHHYGGSSSVLLRKRLAVEQRRKKSTHTRPYANKDGIPVITLMIEKETPKFCSSSVP